jgi:hypothetical protein
LKFPDPPQSFHLLASESLVGRGDEQTDKFFVIELREIIGVAVLIVGSVIAAVTGKQK